jgi:hypothetical protein
MHWPFLVRNIVLLVISWELFRIALLIPASIGSPNLMSAGYFLAQHKPQLGGNKVVARITVWQTSWLPNAVLWIEDEPDEEPDENSDGEPMMIDPPPINVGWRVVKRKADSKNILREHYLGAKL